MPNRFYSFLFQPYVASILWIIYFLNPTIPRATPNWTTLSLSHTKVANLNYHNTSLSLYSNIPRHECNIHLDSTMSTLIFRDGNDVWAMLCKLSKLERPLFTAYITLLKNAEISSVESTSRTELHIGSLPQRKTAVFFNSPQVASGFYTLLISALKEAKKKD